MVRIPGQEREKALNENYKQNSSADAHHCAASLALIL
jgi:hypothetical protein